MSAKAPITECEYDVNDADGAGWWMRMLTDRGCGMSVSGCM